MKHFTVNPITVSTRKKSYPTPTLQTPELLMAALHNKGVDIKLGELLKGGFVSQVYASTFNGQPVVVKHTEHLIPFDPTEQFIDKRGHNTDSFILNKLQQSKNVQVPHLIAHFPDITTTIMEDMRHSGYRLMIDEILQKQFSIKSATAIGSTLASLAKETRTWKSFRTNMCAEVNSYERGLELRLAYPNTQKEYLELEKEFIQNNHYFTWLDGHPKNIFTDADGNVAIIDFGNSSFSDQQYMLPNFLAHVVLYSLSEYIDRKLAQTYIQDCINAYEAIEPIEEKIFCQYLAMELFHRANGKWVSGIESKEQKLACLKFAFSVFDENISSIEKILSSLQ